MSTAFSFFLRLFICFAGAKFLLQAIGADSRGHLVALTLIFLANVYLFSYLIFKDRTKAPSAEEAAEALPGLLHDGDLVLVKASRGVHLDRIVEALAGGKR